MKAEIQKNGSLRITAETYMEAYAIKSLYPPSSSETICPECFKKMLNDRIVYDCSILNDDESA